MVRLEEDEFDVYTNKNTGQTLSVRSFTWVNENKVSVQVITYGATVTFIKVPDKEGVIKDIVTGFTNLAGYQSPENPYFGATVGRVANRIGNGQFKIFDQVLWEPFVVDKKVIMSYHSSDMEEGNPGDVVVQTIFELTDTNEFRVEFKATTTKPTYVNLTNHSYFNLAGHNAGAEELYKHAVCINADKITAVDKDNVPTGQLLPVTNTIFDLRIPKILGNLITQVPNSDGFDHNFCVIRGTEEGATCVARVQHPDSGRVLEVFSNQRGLQFYTSNFFPENPSSYTGDKSILKNLTGKDGNYYKHGAFCLETQNWPDAPNHENFPKWLLTPGEIYYHYVAYKFSVKNISFCNCNKK